MNINFEKYPDGLAPAIVQDVSTGRVLMLGFMNAESLAITQETGKATFYSRSRQTLWTKGETSGNYLTVKSIAADCDADTLLIQATPHGPTCHTGADTCFGETNEAFGFLFDLERTINDRKRHASENSYTSTLFAAGINRIAQKVGEEAVEVVIAAKDADPRPLKSETADLLYHLLVLCAEREIALSDVVRELENRSTR
jgi:phosphoribosyl-ATP pyrophosphohydrolase/phosphoribosyl-AMP cyclohydrolase